MWALKTAKKMPKCVQVEWEDGFLARFNYLWLQDNSPRRPSLVHLDLNTRPEAINCSKDSLNLVWPPFFGSSYSSGFLRETALTPIDYQIAGTSTSTTTPTTANSNFFGIPKISSISTATKKSLLLREESLLNCQKWTIINSIPINSKNVIGQCYWGGSAQEPGTIWPHLQELPSLCSVDILSDDAANLSIVDGEMALALLAKKHPDAFEFLSQCELEYSTGIFRSRHSIVNMENGKILPTIIFNNAARSTAITIEPLEKLYECLQKFGRLCAEMTQNIRLESGQRLIVDNKKIMLGAPAQAKRFLLLRCFS